MQPERYIAKIVNNDFIQVAQQLPEVALYSIVGVEETPETIAQNNNGEKLYEEIDGKIKSGEIKEGQKVMVMKNTMNPRKKCFQCEECNPDCNLWNQNAITLQLAFFKI